MQGIIMKSTGSWYTVLLEDASRVEARLRGKMRHLGLKSTNPVAVGDGVMLERDGDEYWISGVAPRRNYIVRRSVKLSKRTQVIAANIDRALLIISLKDPATLPGFIDRFLVTATAYEIPTTIIVNKVDLFGAKEQAQKEELLRTYPKIGYPVLFTSAETGEGLEEFRELLHNRTTLISGNSGVGKSTLINRVDPKLQLRTGEISTSHRQGQHTTTYAEMFQLDFGGKIIDTPGIRSFGLTDMQPGEVSHYFPEIFEVSEGCKFNNCSHQNEPGCAVIEAVNAGEISHLRYKNYLRIRYDLDDENPYRVDEFAEE
jgi:ribosome biogenesis GTPase